MAENVAWLIPTEGQSGYFVRAQARSPGQPFLGSAATLLVQAIENRFPGRARAILRSRMFIEGEFTEACAGTLKLTAKRWTRVEDGTWNRVQATGEKWTDLSQAGKEPVTCMDSARELWGELLVERPQKDFSGWMVALRAYAASQAAKVADDDAKGVPPRHERDRPVWALLVSAEGRCLEVATHKKSPVRSGHAERRLVEQWVRRTGQEIPCGAKIFTTLQPCKMCAGWIWETSYDCRRENNIPLVIYGEQDPGPMARNTVLETGGWQKECPV